MVELDEFTSRLIGVRHMPSGVAAQCPAHHDQHASLSVNTGDHGGVVVKCHTGCSAEAIVAALHLTMSDLMGKPHVVESYQYVTADGVHAYLIQRWANPKTFRAVPGLPEPAARVLYNLPAVLWAVSAGQPVYVVEGERDVNTLAAKGVVATTNVGGAGKWLPHYNEWLTGAHVVVIADNDAPGREHARAVGAAVRPVAASLALVHAPVGKDVTDFLTAGYSLDKLAPLPDVDEVGSYRADRIKVRGVNWGWGGYFPLGKLSMIEGDPGDGKSLLTIDLAARWSTGANLPDGSNGAGPWPVILVSAEDDMDDTIVPRLMAAGARLDFIHMVTHGATPDQPFDLVNGMPALRGLAMHTGARAILLDPLAAFLGDGTDSHNDHSVRRALQPLKNLAEYTGAAVLVVRHLNKAGAGTKALYRSSGSIGFVGAARAAFIVAPDPNDPASRVLACTKTNLARKPPSLRYEITTTEAGVPFVRWKGPAELSAQMVLDGPDRPESQAAEESRSKRRQREYAGAFLLALLADGPMAWKDIVAAGKEDGFSGRTLERARADVGLINTGGNSSALWHSPALLAGNHETPSGDILAKNARNWGSSVGPQNPAKLAELSPSGPILDTPVPDSGSSPIDDDDRETALFLAELICDVCRSEINVSRYGHPWWAIRCEAHDPMEYGGQ